MGRGEVREGVLVVELANGDVVVGGIPLGLRALLASFCRCVKKTREIINLIQYVI